MLFNSIEFFVFFLIVYVLYRIFYRVRDQNRLLLFSSYVFYGWWDIRFLYLVVLSTGLDFCCGLILGPGRIPRPDRVAVSTCLVLAAVIFVMPRWNAIHLDSPLTSVSASASIGKWPRHWGRYASISTRYSPRVGWGGRCSAGQLPRFCWLTLSTFRWCGFPRPLDGTSDCC